MGSSVLSSLSDLQQQASDFASSRRSPFGLPLPRVALPVNKFGFAALTAGYGVEVLLLQFPIKANWFFLATELVLGFTGTGNAPNAGDVSYTVDIDIPLGGAQGKGYYEKDFQAVPFPLGSTLQGPWKVEFRHRNRETIRIKGTPVANMGVGASNFLVATLSGWEWPEGGFELS